MEVGKTTLELLVQILLSHLKILADNGCPLNIYGIGSPNVSMIYYSL